jgi:hypothetical protein
MSVATKTRRKRTLPSLDSVTAQIADSGYDLTLTDQSIEHVASVGFRGNNLALALVATNMLIEEQPITLRGLMYRVVSAGWLPSTDRKPYQKLLRIMVRLRESGIIPFEWIVHGIRSTIKPSSWSGIADFADTVRNAYRMDFRARLDTYVHIIAEKDAIAGVLSPVTEEYDVRLSPLRGYSSISFAHEIAAVWNRIQKPIFAYYLGDFDPSGFDLERDAYQKIKRYTRDAHPWWYEPSDNDTSTWTGGCVVWRRLAVDEDDIANFDLLPLAVKATDTRARRFIEEHGDECAELDALPSSELRRRVRDAIESHIPQEEWAKLKDIERHERELFNSTIAQFGLSNSQPQ